MNGIAALILAAGKGTRMKSATCKVLHSLAGRPMLSYVLDSVSTAQAEKIVVVVGHQARDVMERFANAGAEFVEQKEQLGTGHAVQSAKASLEGFKGDILILCGDTPLVTAAALRELSRFHQSNRSRFTVMTTIMADPKGYGRIMRSPEGEVLSIVEERDATDEEGAVQEINTGIYLAEARLLFAQVDRIGHNNDQGEYYLTDIVAQAVNDGISVHGFRWDYPEQVMGINTRVDLANVTRRIWEQLREKLMLSGVTLLDPETFYPDYGVAVGSDTVIYPCVTLSGDTRIGSNCVIESSVIIKDCQIGDGVIIRLGSRLECAKVEDGATIGPMAHLRPDSQIGKRARIGNFVEVKKTVVGEGSKAAHLTYLGDSLIGRDVNIGCGTITCNYDGKKKHTTTIHDRCFVGSDVQFVAPVEIGAGSVIGAGSTITRDVPPGSLSVSRAKQKNYPLRKGQGPSQDNEDRGSRA